MPRTHQVRSPAHGIDCHLDCACAIMSRDAGSYTVARLDAFVKSRTVRRGVLPRHRPDTQVIQAFRRHGQADQPAPEFGHEVDGLRGDLFRRHCKIAFVFAVFVVDDHDHPPGVNLLDRRGNIGKGGINGHTKPVEILAFPAFAGSGKALGLQSPYGKVFAPAL